MPSRWCPHAVPSRSRRPPWPGCSGPAAATSCPSPCATAPMPKRRAPRLDIWYTACDGRLSERAPHQYGLVAHSRRRYVTGTDPAIGEDRTFLLDHITDARTPPGSFEPHAGLRPGASCRGSRRLRTAARWPCAPRARPSTSARDSPPTSRPWQSCPPRSAEEDPGPRTLDPRCAAGGAARLAAGRASAALPAVRHRVAGRTGGLAWALAARMAASARRRPPRV
jgi:hypothetical protein